MSFLKIENLNNSDQYFYIDKLNANKLEILFNLSNKGKEWKVLGDMLYDYSIGKNKNKIKIVSEKFHFLRKLINENNLKKFNHKKDINI
jgi:hypothetical protein